MAQEVPEPTYEPEVEEDARRKREHRVVQEGTALWRRRKEELQRQKHREQRELQEILANYSPWGKPGGGAPCAATLRKRNVPLEPLEPLRCHSFGQRRIVDFSDHVELETLLPQSIASETQLQDPRNFYKEEVQVYKLTGGVELVPLLTSRRHQSYPQSSRYLATDATRPGYTIESLRALGVDNREYIADLAEQIRRKRDRALSFSNVTNHSVLGSRFRKNGGSNKRVVAGTSILGKGCGVDPATVPP
ncbi:hypothetical protein G5I_12802 [Acromyrmex echinatior]|uniref:Uncharacterized protein n=1 Tax=Acromyrmex echinatior TaxID=103372 RepID=F4X3A8_ACREC|nr:hypothetical protein G5I_12802 [Acromyrmex echinatior]